MVVHGGALAGAPGHGHHAVAVCRAAVQLAAGVVVVNGVVHALRKLHVPVADHAAQHAAQGRGHGVLVTGADGGIQGGDQLVVAGEVEVG
ncbi:hypothetical protein D3C84_1086410 [compost metagenome]